MTFPRLPLFPWTAAVTLSRDEARRLLNVVIATLALLFALPVMVAIAVLIKLTSRGPVLFAQRRIGLDRRAPWHGGRNPRRHSVPRGPAFPISTLRPTHGNGG